MKNCSISNKHVMESVSPAERRVKIKDLCRTRWYRGCISILIFTTCILQLSGVLLISTCSSEYGDGSWDSGTLTKANSFHHQLTLEFHVSFYILLSLVFNTEQSTFKRELMMLFLHMNTFQMGNWSWNC